MNGFHGASLPADLDDAEPDSTQGVQDRRFDSSHEFKAEHAQRPHHEPQRPQHQHDEPSSALGLLEQLPLDLLASHIWCQLPRNDRRRLRQAGRAVAQYAASELMTHIQVLVCRTSLLQLTTADRHLHHRFPRPAALTLRLLPPARRDGCEGAVEGHGGGVEGWHGSTAVMSYFLSELGVATSVTSLSLQGWQELSPRDLHHVAASYPRLARLHLAGLPGNNYLSGPSLEPLGRCAQWLREVVVDTQVVMDAQAALDALSRLPRLASLELSAMPLLASLDLPLAGLTGLTRLAVTFEHKHAHSEQQLTGLAALTRLRHLALDFMQLGTGSSLWSAGWLLAHLVSSLASLTALHLPRAFLYDKSHPDFLRTLAALPCLTDLALGSVILSPETAAAAAAATANTAAAATAAAAEAAGWVPAAAAAAACRSAAAGAAAVLSRPWRRLALGASMPCYLECLLPALGVEQRIPDGFIGGLAPALAPVASRGAVLEARGADEAEVEGRLAQQQQQRHTEALSSQQRQQQQHTEALLQQQQPAAIPSVSLSDTDPMAAAVPLQGCRGDGGGGGGLELLELSTPCTLQMVQLLPQFVRAGPAGQGQGQGQGRTSGGVREVRLMLRLASNWADVVAALAGVGPALTSLALLPTYLYGSGTMMGPQVLAAVAAALPHLTHLEFYRLNADPRDVACLADLPRLRFVLLGVAEEARERRGPGYPSSVVRSLLGAMHARSWQDRGGWRAAADDDPAGAAAMHGSDGDGQSADKGCCREKAAAGAGRRSLRSAGPDGGRTGAAAGAVVCCPELTVDEAERLDEMCETEYGVYDSYGSRLRVERALESTLPWRLAVGCSMAPSRWRA